MKTWDEFKKYENMHTAKDPLDFYGCVDAKGLWFDSSVLFETAVHWCCMNKGAINLTTEEEVRWMDNEGRSLGYSVIHGTMIKKMYEKGMIK